jgi:hypothetical protein
MNEVKFIPVEQYQEKEVVKKTTPYMSPYEYSALLTFQALQIASTKEYSPELAQRFAECNYNLLTMAERDIRDGNATLIIRRTLPNGEVDDWHIKDLILPKK